MNKNKRYLPEGREQAVRLALEHQGQDGLGADEVLSRVFRFNPAKHAAH